jgi:membrane-bound metal-dependent hydrolase YbcI (DUF457 family)
MDTFSHALWGLGLFGQRGRPWLALLFGALPDLMSFGALLVLRVATGTFAPGAPRLETIPGWTYVTYNFGHSLLISGVATALVFFLWRRDIGFAMLAWPFHIMLDFPFHSREFFPTKLFWPLSDITFDGVSWGTPWVWYPNLAGLVVLFSWRWIQRRRRQRAASLGVSRIKRSSPSGSANST